MEKTLNELNFKNINQDSFEGWSKIYDGFILFLARIEYSDNNYLASLLINKTEISIPFTVDEYWIVEFDSENSI